MCDVLDRIEKRGIQQGENLLAQLIQKLFALGRIEDVKRVAEDKEYRQMLLKEFSEQEKEEFDVASLWTNPITVCNTQCQILKQELMRRRY